MTSTSDKTSRSEYLRMRDPDYMPPTGMALVLGVQHVLAMFASNITPAIIVAGAAGFGFGSNSPDFPALAYMIQMSILFAGIATLLQTVGVGPVGARLPIVQGTSFAFLPIMIPLVVDRGSGAMAVLACGIVFGGLFQACLAPYIGRLRVALPPLVTGLVVLMIGLSLVKVGIQYAAGGVNTMGTAEFGSLQNWLVAGVVVVTTLCLKFFTRGFLSVSAIVIGLAAGYLVALFAGMVEFRGVDGAAAFALPSLFYFGFEFSLTAIILFSLMSVVSAIETVGDVSGIARGGADREATVREIRGATLADGLGSALSGLFGALPNTSFSQNVGLVAMTGVMSRWVVTIGALFLILCGFLPKVGAALATIPIAVLGGGVILMFGMVVSTGVSILSRVHWNRRNMVIFGTALSIGLGLQLVPEAIGQLPDTAAILMASGLLPAAIIAIVLNLLLPQEISPV